MKTVKYLLKDLFIVGLTIQHLTETNSIIKLKAMNVGLK